MITSIDIVPKEVSKYIHKIQIVDVKVNPFENCIIFIYMVDENGVFIKSLTLTMTNEEYNLWNDDDYLIDWILQKVDAVKKEVSTTETDIVIKKSPIIDKTVISSSVA